MEGDTGNKTFQGTKNDFLIGGHPACKISSYWSGEGVRLTDGEVQNDQGSDHVIS